MTSARTADQCGQSRVADDLRSTWTCDSCSVRCYRMTGEPFPRPERWKGDTCLACLDAEEKISEQRDRVQGKAAEKERKAEALTAALKSDPTRGNKELAAEVGCTMKNVADERERLGLPTSKEARVDAKRAVARERLREDPTRGSVDLATELKSTVKLVAEARDELGLPKATSGPKKPTISP